MLNPDNETSEPLTGSGVFQTIILTLSPKLTRVFEAIPHQRNHPKNVM